MRKVCQRVPQKVVETQTMTRPTWKWEQRCDNITFSRTEYYTETEVQPHVKNIMVTKDILHGAVYHEQLNILLFSATHSEESLFLNSVLCLCYCFLAEMGRIPYCGRPESSSSNI